MNDLKSRILGMVANDLEAIEVELEGHLNPHLDLVRDVAGHILFSGGKRLRPLLLVLAARLKAAALSAYLTVPMSDAIPGSQRATRS